MINKNHTSNIDLEQNRSINEYDFIRSSMVSSIDFSSPTETLKILLERYGSYYEERGIQFSIYQNQEYLYHGLTGNLLPEFEELLSVMHDTKMVRILNIGEAPYILVSGFLDSPEPTIFIYARQIREIYTARSNSIRLTVIFTLGLVVILSSLSYLFSRWMTRPITSLLQGAVAISQEDKYDQVPETRDEFGDLAVAFNVMSAAVRDRTSELEEKAQELQLFIDNLSHEMNTPLTSIQGYAEFLRNANATEEQRLFSSDHIQKQAARMKDIYTKLMTLTLTREHPPELIYVNIEDIFQNLQDTFYPLTLTLGINLTFENHLKEQKLDQTLFELLLGNLIKNSIQAMTEGQSIMVKAFEEEGKSIFQVEDNGIGIPEEYMANITKPFYRVDKSRSRKTGGAGLGLSICNNIVLLHQGELKISSSPGKGTVVQVIL